MAHLSKNIISYVPHFDAFENQSLERLEQTEFVQHVQLTVASQIARSKPDRILASHMDFNLRSVMESANIDFHFFSGTTRKDLVKLGWSDSGISQMIETCNDQLRYLLKDVLQKGYRTVRSWKIELAAMLIAFHAGAKKQARSMRQQIKLSFGQDIYEDARKLAKKFHRTDAINWFKERSIVSRICSLARVQSAVIFEIAATNPECAKKA